MNHKVLRNILNCICILCILMAFCSGCVTIPEITQDPTAPTSVDPNQNTATVPSCLVPTVTAPEHIHDYVQKVIPPDCVSGGYTVFTCFCGDTYQSEETAATGHNWGAWEVVQEATAESEGKRMRHCKNCLTSQEEMLEKLPHIHSYTAQIIDPSCTEDGCIMKICTCGDSYEDGKIHSLGHSYSRNVMAPGCVEPGYTEHICQRCGDSYRDAETAATGHSYTAALILPTCVERGYTVYTCACGESYTGSFVDAVGHSWGQWIVTSQPTATSEGKQERTCRNCGVTEQTSIDRLPAVHTHDYAKEKVAASCTEGGYTVYTCSCGDSYREDGAAAKGHSWSDWLVTEKPTASAQGRKERKCEHCDASESAFVDVLASENGFLFVFWTETVHRNEEATLRILGQPGVTYDIDVLYKSGESSAKGLEDQTADADGYVTWSWKIGGRTTAGTFQIVVTGNGESQTVYFTVVVE